MNIGRFFVTIVLGVGSVQIVGCTHKPTDNKAQIERGNQTLATAQSVESELSRRYSIALARTSPTGDYNWRRLSKADREEAKEKLAEYVSLTSQVLQIDARRGFYVTHRDVVIAKRDSAFSFQKSLEKFEKVYGENFEPKGDDSPAPVYNKSHQA